MAALANLGNGSGFLYVVDLDGTSIIANLANTPTNARKIIQDALPIAGLIDDPDIFSSVYGKRYFINTAGTAGSLTGASEITQYVVNRGLNAPLVDISSTIASGVITPGRYACLIKVTVDTQGGAASDDLDTITATNYVDGDIIFLRGTNSGRVVTVKNGTGNILLANSIDFNTAEESDVLTLQFISPTWYEISRSPNPELSVDTMRAAGIAIPAQGVNTTALTNGGGTINLEPGVDKGYQVYTGTITMSASWTIQIQAVPATPYLDGDEMIVDYRALATTGANTVTIFGIALTTTQALEGRVILLAKYKLSNTTWYYTILYKSQGVDITNKAYVDATFEPVLGNPAGNGYILSSTTAGVRSWIPVAGGLSAVYVGNTVYVDATYGDDLTGAVERLDLPFETIAAARAALNVAYPVGARTGEVRYLVDVRSGEYNEQIILDNYTDYNLNNSIIDVQAGAIYTIDDNNVACDSIIYGNATIMRSTAGSLGCIRTQNASTNLTVYCNQITGSRTALAEILCTNGTQNIIVNKSITSTSAGGVIQCTAGSQNISVLSGTINSNDTTGAGFILNQTGGTQTIKGNIRHTGSNCAVIIRTAGTQYIYGNITTSALNDPLTLSSTGTTYVFGNIAASSTGGSAVTISGSGNFYITGDITNGVGGGGVDSSSTGTVIIKGNCNEGVSSTGISLTGAGIMRLYGNTTSANCSAGTQYVYGNVSWIAAGSGGSDAVSCSGTGVQYIDGNISTNDTHATTAYGIIYSSSGTSYYRGNITSVNSPSLNITAGTVVIRSGSRIGVVGAANAISKNGGTLKLEGGVSLLALTNSVASTGAEDILVYGVCSQNVSEDATTTYIGGSVITNASLV